MTHHEPRSPGNGSRGGSGKGPRNGLVFLCDGSVSHSQMAEAFARYIGPTDLRYYSACSSAGRLHPSAIKVMRELGIDISSYQVMTLEEIPFDTVASIITLCAEEKCPPLPAGITHLPWPMPEPAEQLADDEELVHGFRRVRDEIREFVSRLF
jgi:arsenate reductase